MKAQQTDTSDAVALFRGLARAAESFSSRCHLPSAEPLTAQRANARPDRSC